MSGAKHKRKPASMSVSKAELSRRLLKQKQTNKIERQAKRALAAIRSFRVKKTDKGKYHFIGTNGKKGASDKGRVGYMVYVTKSGKKKPVKNYNAKEPFRPTKITNFKLKHNRTLRIPQKDFTKSQLQLTAAGQSVSRGGGSISISGAYDFSDKVVTKIARNIQKVINAQQSRRSFIIEAKVLIALPDGETKVYDILIPIAKQDREHIELAGINNFVSRKFYAYMARQLAFHGYVSSGSANHIRRLGINQGKPKSDWRQSDGHKWRGNENEIVKIKHIDWRLLQAK